MGAQLDIDDVASGNPVAERELAELRVAAARYEEVRKWTPSVFVEVWRHCMSNSIDTFDGMVDALRSNAPADRSAVADKVKPVVGNQEDKL